MVFFCASRHLRAETASGTFSNSAAQKADIAAHASDLKGTARLTAFLDGAASGQVKVR